MGNLRDELEKLFGKVKGKQTSALQPAKPPAESPRISAQVTPEPDWKAGATPLDPGTAKKVAISENAGRDAKRPMLGKLRLPWARPKVQPSAPLTRSPEEAPAQPQPVKTLSQPVLAPPLAPAKPPTPVRQDVPAPDFGTFRPPSLARDREFKLPDGWVSAGAELQPPNSSGGRVLPVRIGIDFGSAYTKVALRGADRVFFLPWDGVRASAVRYFLPGEIASTHDGATWLGRAPGAEIRSDLKLPFVARVARTREQQAAAVAFLAWVMRYARAWLYQSQPALLRDRTLAWQVNLGCPANSWSTHDLRASYEDIGLRGWHLSQTPQEVSWEGALAALAAAQPTAADVGLDGLKLMPEFIAQIAGYVRSPQRRNGLHFLMDVGAGTVDIATFNVVYDEKKEEDRYPIFASEVRPLGTHFLMESRLSRLGLLRGAWDDLQAVPDAAEVARQLKVDGSRVRQLDEEFIGRVAAALKRILDYTHDKRYGKAPEWREGLPAFLSGGGSDCEIYTRSLALAFAKHGVPLKRTAFPLLQDIEGAGEGNFHRLSVAYGLTFDAESIGRILSPHEVDDAPRFDPAVDRSARERPDRDELYPK